MEPQRKKQQKGQFYTTRSAYILEDMPLPPSTISRIIEPFAGKGDLIQWIRDNGCLIPIEAYDIDPQDTTTIYRDTLMNPPDYTDAWVITNPPYLARNKSEDKRLYDVYHTNDLYKCFLHSICCSNKNKGCLGGIIIIPAGFFFSPRDMDTRCRNEFLSKYRIIHVRYFEETVFYDTTTTIVAIAFERSYQPLTEQNIVWELLPSKEKKTFYLSAQHHWIIGGEIYSLPTIANVSIRRHVEGLPLRENEQQTHILLNALDSGRKDGGRISLTYKPNYVYPAKDCSRTFASLRITGRVLSESEQEELCIRFNAWLEEKRKETWSLFLPQFRESKEYARKRIPFELVYRIVLYLLIGMVTT